MGVVILLKIHLVEYVCPKNRGFKLESFQYDKTLVKNISYECRHDFDVRKYNSKQNWNNDKCQYECKKS